MRILGASNDPFAKPLLWGFLNGSVVNPFTIATDSPAVNGKKFRDNAVDLAMLAPIDFGRYDRPARLVYGSALVAAPGAGLAILAVPKPLDETKTIAVDPRFPNEIVLAQIILNEVYDHSVTFVPADGTVESMLAKADAVLLAGINAWQPLERSMPKLNLIEEWDELTNLPYVALVTAVKENKISKEELSALEQSALEGSLNPSLIAAGENISGLPKGLMEEIFSDYLYFQIDHRAADSLEEFYRYAFYHQILRGIPDIRPADPADLANDEDGSDPKSE